jgi:hypothetical protein
MRRNGARADTMFRLLSGILDIVRLWGREKSREILLSAQDDQGRDAE